MYPFSPCSDPGCASIAFAGSGLCMRHHRDPEALQAEIAARLVTENPVKDLNLEGLALEGVDLSKKRFFGCSFIGASLRSVLFTNSVFRLCLFDDSRMDSCDFSTCEAQFCSFGGADLLNVSFENSELLHCNFDGAKIKESTFNASNLYDSRFIRCEIENSDFVNCDLKRVYLIPSKLVNASFKGSNTMEAIRDLEHLYL